MAAKRITFLTLALFTLVSGLAIAAGPIADLRVDSSRLSWTPNPENASFERAILTVSRPDGVVVRREFRAGQAITFDLFDAAGNNLADGSYNWELHFAPRLDARQREAVANARRANDPAAEAQILASVGLDKRAVQSGSFAIAGGSAVDPDNVETRVAPRAAAPRTPTAGTGGPTRDVVVADDQIVQGSLCVGFDCVNNESFGFDTIRLKENSTRIKFEDTSAAGFPSNDWQLTANDSASGGANKFSIEDITGARVPFTVTGGAATNSIFVDSTGRVGYRTATPVLDLHISTSNTPALRMEQTAAGGFTAQTWDIAGNEANFFVRDVTGGSRLPFRIRPGAPTSSIDIAADGDVGIGLAAATAALHVRRSTGTAKIFVEETSATVDFRELLELRNTGEPFLIFNNSSSGNRWSNGLNGGSFQILDQADAQVEFTLTGAGNLTVSGTLTPMSSRTMKTDFSTVDSREVLAKVVALPISTWNYKADQGVLHMGPMSEDFHAAFKLGTDNKGISVTDSAGVAFAAIQGLHSELEQKNAELQAENARLEQRLAALEKLVETLAVQKQ